MFIKNFKNFNLIFINFDLIKNKNIYNNYYKIYLDILVYYKYFYWILKYFYFKLNFIYIQNLWKINYNILMNLSYKKIF